MSTERKQLLQLLKKKVFSFFYKTIYYRIIYRLENYIIIIKIFKNTALNVNAPRRKNIRKENGFDIQKTGIGCVVICN